MTSANLSAITFLRYNTNSQVNKCIKCASKPPDGGFFMKTVAVISYIEKCAFLAHLRNATHLWLNAQ